MLTISGLKRFYYIPGMTDMRCGYNRLLQIVKQMTHHDPYNGDVFVFMSKDRRKVKMVHFENHAWKDLVAVLESPVVKKLRLK